MKVKGIIDEDFVNYKKPAMYIAFPNCNFKCDIECGQAVCQNSSLVDSPEIEIRCEEVVKRYLNNPITKALICAGLEPFDSWLDLQYLIMRFRYYSPDEVVIYTGYKEEEVQDKIEWLELYSPVIVKFGRFIPNNEPHYDKILGVNLASDNQYAKEIKMNKKYILTVNPDKEEVSRIREAIKANDGYCPCQLEKTERTKCVCKNFIESDDEWCHCGLYQKKFV